MIIIDDRMVRKWMMFSSLIDNWPVDNMIGVLVLLLPIALVIFFLIDTLAKKTIFG